MQAQSSDWESNLHSIIHKIGERDIPVESRTAHQKTNQFVVQNKRHLHVSITEVNKMYVYVY